MPAVWPFSWEKHLQSCDRTVPIVMMLAKTAFFTILSIVAPATGLSSEQAFKQVTFLCFRIDHFLHHWHSITKESPLAMLFCVKFSFAGNRWCLFNKCTLRPLSHIPFAQQLLTTFRLVKVPCSIVLLILMVFRRISIHVYFRLFFFPSDMLMCNDIT